ncbi:MAG: hypothetical protein HEP71_23035 [Roseivirga sp.]|nr:hypothetical protein [Roseivirga sp.]
MNKKKLIGNLLLVALVVGLSLTFFKPGLKDRSYEGQIQAFILNRLEEGKEDVKYIPLNFQEVNEAFLLAQDEVMIPMGQIEDTIQSQLDLMKRQYVSEDFKQLINKAEAQLESLNLASVSDYLTLDAKLKRTIKQAEALNSTLKHELHQEETKMMSAINELNAALGQFNLSVFSLDFEKAQSKLYYHTFQLADSDRTTDHKMIFELSGEKKEVISFKEI